jgi:hypothetical protein
MLAELEEAEGDAALDADDDEEEEYVYNPLKLPLGWDGKPIPYWLYKLHGLNQEFKCEICGNYRCGLGRVRVCDACGLGLGQVQWCWNASSECHFQERRHVSYRLRGLYVQSAHFCTGARKVLSQSALSAGALLCLLSLPFTFHAAAWVRLLSVQLLGPACV